MTDCTGQLDLFSIGRRKVSVRFDGEEITSDSGVLPLSLMDTRLRLSERLSAVLWERRDPSKVEHSLEDQFRQRILQICCGYEDCNDATTLRHDAGFQTAFGRTPGRGSELASQPTLSRFEDRSQQEVELLGDVMIDMWIERVLAGGPSAWKRIILDFDGTDDPTYGSQQGTMFHGYYDQFMYQPLIVFDGEGWPVTVLLRPGNAHGADGTEETLLRLFEKITECLPSDAKFLFRADAAFARPSIMELCDALDIDYVIGMNTHQVLREHGTSIMERARAEHQAALAGTTSPLERRSVKTRVFGAFDYAAGSWSNSRRIIMKAEITPEGENPRFVVTTLGDEPSVVYDEVYTARGQAENYIKELKNAMYADRLSCHLYDANAFRLILHTAAYMLMFSLREQIRSIEPTADAGKMQMDTLRLKLIKIGASIRVTARNIWIRLSSSHPMLPLWRRLTESLSPG